MERMGGRVREQVQIREEVGPESYWVQRKEGLGKEPLGVIEKQGWVI